MMLSKPLETHHHFQQFGYSTYLVQTAINNIDRSQAFEPTWLKTQTQTHGFAGTAGDSNLALANVM